MVYWVCCAWAMRFSVVYKGRQSDPKPGVAPTIFRPMVKHFHTIVLVRQFRIRPFYSKTWFQSVLPILWLRRLQILLPFLSHHLPWVHLHPVHAPRPHPRPYTTTISIVFGRPFLGASRSAPPSRHAVTFPRAGKHNCFRFAENLKGN